MAVWLVRAGKHGEREQTALEKSVLVIGWNELPDLSGVESREALADLYRKRRPDASSGKVSNHVGQLWSFRKRMQPGDLAVLPLKTRSAIAIGKVMGAYQYTTDLGDGVRHIHKVEWLRTELPRTAFACISTKAARQSHRKREGTHADSHRVLTSRCRPDQPPGNLAPPPSPRRRGEDFA
jgi:restriction system protein